MCGGIRITNNENLYDYRLLRAFKKALNDVIMSRRAINNMNNLYPDVTQDELANTDNVCIICREEMTGGIISIIIGALDIS
jgi:hypothetical protein